MHKRCLHVFWRKNSRESILNFMSKFLSGETLCKFYQIFPPKVLVYIWTNFSWHFCNYLIEIQLFNKNKIIVRKTLVLDSNDFIDKNKEVSKQHWVWWLLLNNNRNLIFITTKKKKNRRMRILGACIFSKFFGGKMKSLKQMLLTELAWK